MAPQDILRKLKARPFAPFRVHVSDGAAYDVTEPTHAYVFLTEFVIGVEPDAFGVPAKGIYIAPNHVTRIEPITPAKA